MTCFLFTFILTSTGYWLLLWYALRRVLNHLRNNPEAQTAITKHVMTPLFGDKPEEKS
ncbi:MAG: hypothetical protein JWO38_3315 [Gemmataceae bacterium]|nr:hypothetical protein [Gemmataceae bacterium]